MVVPPADPQALADAIMRLVSGEVDKGALAAKARRIVESGYDLERTHCGLSFWKTE